MNFGSIDAFLVHLAALQAGAAAAQRRGLGAAGRMLEGQAKAMIGTEMPGWEPLAPSTIDEKERLGYGVPDPLLRTGELRGSIHHAADDHGVTLGTDDPIAPHQEFGTGHIPPRPFIGSTLYSLVGEASDVVGNYVMGHVAGKSGPLRPIQKRDGDDGAS